MLGKNSIFRRIGALVTFRNLNVILIKQQQELDKLILEFVQKNKQDYSQEDHKTQRNEGLIVLSWKLPFLPPGSNGGGFILPKSLSTGTKCVCSGHWTVGQAGECSLRGGRKGGEPWPARQSTERRRLHTENVPENRQIYRGHPLELEQSAH